MRVDEVTTGVRVRPCVYIVRRWPELAGRIGTVNEVVGRHVYVLWDDLDDPTDARGGAWVHAASHLRRHSTRREQRQRRQARAWQGDVPTAPEVIDPCDCPRVGAGRPYSWSKGVVEEHAVWCPEHPKHPGNGEVSP